MNPDFSPIEYIGPRGKKRRRIQGTKIGGWLLLLLALAIGACFLRPLLPSLQARQSAPNTRDQEQTIEELREADTMATRLAAAALARIEKLDEELTNLEPVADNSADLIVESYQAVGIDLPQLVQEDMTHAFRYYNSPWSRQAAEDAGACQHIPHLQRFFSRWGTSLNVRSGDTVFQFGDIVVWELPATPRNDMKRVMGIVVPGPESRKGEHWVVSRDGDRLEWTDKLYNREIVGHYRYAPVSDEVARLEMAGVTTE